MSPADTQDDFDAAQDRARRDRESREQAADDRHNEPACDWCNRRLKIVFEPDGDKLCWDCANLWVQGEGQWAREHDDEA